MNRREAFRLATIISAGAVLLPSCKMADKAGVVLKNLRLTGNQEETLAALTETIIPGTGNFIGAKQLESYKFLLTMMDDCNSPEDQQLFTTGMKKFEEACEQKFSTSFSKCSITQRNELLKQLETGKTEADSTVQFYKTVKRYTVQSFTSSKEFMTDIRKYKIVPGPVYKGCVQVKASV
jgi:hypothetical protein